jgi:NTE family protein
MVDGRRFVDGGVRSPTNADVLRRSGVDVAVLLSPMSGRGLGRLGLEAAIRRHARRKAVRELAVLRSRGIRTLLLEPGPEVLWLAGMDFMSEEHVREIVGAAFLDAGEQLRTSEARKVLADLARRGPGSAIAG